MPVIVSHNERKYETHTHLLHSQNTNFFLYFLTQESKQQQQQNLVKSDM